LVCRIARQCIGFRFDGRDVRVRWGGVAAGWQACAGGGVEIFNSSTPKNPKAGDVLRINRAVGGFEDGGILSFGAVVGRERVAIQPASNGSCAAAGDDLRTGWIVYVDGDGEAGFAGFAGGKKSQELTEVETCSSMGGGVG